MSDTYDELPYPTFTFPQTSPDRLATLGILHDLRPADASKCRYLELGCGSGTNVAYSASIFTESEFVGIDLNEKHIETAVKTAADLGLKNAAFHAADLLSVSATELGKFDLIVAHGLFSWVPATVRDRVLEIMRDCLSEDGIGYISYNTFPGCHVRKIGWDLFRLGNRNTGGPMDQIESARSVISFIGSAAEEGTLQREIYEGLAADLSGKSPEVVFHDDLAIENRPYYFLEFAALLDQFGLRYVCEADPESLSDGLSASDREMLDSIAKDRSEREQYLDFIDLAKFRMSLICKDRGKDVDGPVLLAVRKLHAISPLRLVSERSTLDGDKTARFATADGRGINVNHPLTKTVLASFKQTSSVALNELIEDDSPEAERTCGFLLSLYSAGLVKLFSEPKSASGSVSDRPSVHPFARWQAAAGCDCMTSILGENIKIDSELLRKTVTLLDGTRDRSAIENDLVRIMYENENDRKAAMGQLPAILDANLKVFAELGLLEA